MKALNVKTGVDENGKNSICPFCEKELDFIKDYRSHLKLFSNMHVFSCPYCRKVLSVIAGSK